MNLQEFQEAVFRELGPCLERATPANIREFTARMQARLFDRREAGRIVLGTTNEPESCEQILQEFFAQVLRDPPERAAMILWLTAMELWFAVLAPDSEETSVGLFENRPES